MSLEPSTISSSPQPPDALVSAIRKLLRPLVRLMMHYQLSYPFVSNLLKTLYVEVADQEFAVAAKRQTDSRITLLTGVHRKDVKRLRNEPSTVTQLPKAISVGAQLIAVWLGSEEFLDKAGAPLALPQRNSNPPAGQSTFDDLVERVCKQDIRPRVILDEWLRLGIAHVDEGGKVRLNTGAFTPEKGFDEKAFFFAKNLHDHMSASAHNLMGVTPSYFDRSVYYDKLSYQSIQELNALANATGMEALTKMNKAALSLQQKDATGSDRHYRMNFGIFNYNAQLPEEPAEDEGAQDA